MNDWQQRIASTRMQVESFHPTPPLFDCLAYAVTEAGEALDAVLRIKRNGDDRTRAHDQKDSLGRELAQMAYMLGTAANGAGYDLGPLACPSDVKPEAALTALSIAVTMVGDTVRAFSSASPTVMKDALLMARSLALWGGYNLEDELDLWLAELRQREPCADAGMNWTQTAIPEIEYDAPLFAMYGDGA